MMIKHRVFKDNGLEYGGNQSSLKYRWDNNPEQRELIRKQVSFATQKEWDDDELSSFLNKLHRQGCGYVAAISIILANFSGAEQTYERLYKVSYFTKNGRVNFEDLLLKFYYQERNQRLLPFLNFEVTFAYPGVRGRDLFGNIQRFTYQRGCQIIGYKLPRYSRKQLEKCIKNSLKEEHFPVLTTYFWPMILLTPSGKKYSNQQLSMHSVLITDYDHARQQFIVSSWGKKYYLEDLPLGATCYSYT